MVNFSTATFYDSDDAFQLARQIAKYCAAGGENVALVTRDVEKIKTADQELTVVESEKEVPGGTDIVIKDYGNASASVIKPADKIYIIADARRISAEKLAKHLNTLSYECELVLYGTNDMSDYKALVPKVIKVADIEKTECQYEIRMALDLFSHQKGFSVPDPNEAFEYEAISTSPEKTDADEEDDKKHFSAAGITSLFKRNKDNDDDEDDDDIVEPSSSGHIEYEEDDSWQSKAAEIKDALADGLGSAISTMKEMAKRKRQEQKEKKKEKDKDDDGPIKTRPESDWAKKTKALDSRAKTTNQIFSLINFILILVVIIMTITTFLAFRESKHQMVSLKELYKTEFPVKVETDGISVKPYSGFAKNRKVAVVIGDDSFVKKDSKLFQSLSKKEAVETRKYEVTVTYSANPLRQQMYGTLTFVHHSAFGEGDFSKKEIAEIMDYSEKWFTKKRYDLFRFNDRDTINVNDPPDSLLRYVGKDD